tara:strand:+ start:6767 stop:7963 length:1197 start_codon:yes stop_codon:yes gene_type:complete
MNILLAFDKFKGSLTAGEACRIAGEAVRAEWPEATISEAPLTDGGEGFCPILTEAAKGRVERVSVSDPLQRPIDATVGWVEADQLPLTARARLGCVEGQLIAVIEMASASGLPILAQSERDPWKTTTLGTGELMRHAVEEGADLILLGVGGSATNDCGAGLLEALGARFFDCEGNLIAGITPENFDRVAEVDFSDVLELPPVVVASDVQSPLLGEFGATRVFGPQKGLLEVDRMEASYERMARRIATGSPLGEEVVWEKVLSPGMGAAGGISFALSATAEVRIEPGFALVSDWMGIDQKLVDADWVLTGEGRLDRSSLSGKGPVALLREAVVANARVGVFAGGLEKGVPEELSKELGGCDCVELSRPGWTLEKSVSETKSRLAEELSLWAIKRKASTE